MIVLSEYGNDFLVALTTSQQHNKKRVQGCQINDTPPNYFIPKNTNWFELDTWILLNEALQLDSNILSQKKGNIKLHENVLPIHLIKDILKCTLSSEDIDEFDLEFIQRAFDKL